MRGVLLLVSLLLSLALAECAARVVVDEVDLQVGIRDGGVLVPYEPGARADLLADEFRVRYEINEHGHRDRLDRRAERTPGVPRIVLLGDSFAAGWGVELEDSFGARLERATGTEVVNAAKNGGCPLWFVPQGRHLRERFAPDWLLVQVFDNDPADNANWRHRFQLAIGERFAELPPELGIDASLHHRLSRAFDSLVLRDRFRRLTRRLRGKNVNRSPYVEPGARAGVLVLTREEAIARHGVVIGPEAPFGPDFAFHLPEQRDAWRERIAWNAALVEQVIEESRTDGVPVALLYIPVYQVFLREPAPNPLAESLGEVARRWGAPWLDAEAAFAARPRPWELYHAHDGHLNAAGHAALAELLERELAPRVTAPGG